MVTSVAGGQPQQNPGSSLLQLQLAKQTTSDPTPDIINKVATCHAGKVPNDNLHPLINQGGGQGQGGQGQAQGQVGQGAPMGGIKAEPEIKSEPVSDGIKTEIKEEPMDSSGDNKVLLLIFMNKVLYVYFEQSIWRHNNPQICMAF